MNWIGIIWVMIASALPTPARAADPAPESRFVVSSACAACHAKESSAWQGSRHRVAMQVADEKNGSREFQRRAQPWRQGCDSAARFTRER